MAIVSLWRGLSPLLAAALLTGAPLSEAAVKKKHPHMKSATSVKSTARSASARSGPTYGQREDVRQFADEVAARRGLDAQWTRRTLAQAHQVPVVARLILPPQRGVSKNWAAYRARFVEPTRIQAGVAFWQANRETLARAEQEFGVPAEIVVGILGVETLYGRDMGTFKELDALATLAFDFPAAHPRADERREFFKGELEQYLSLAFRSGIAADSVRGSYAGAMGMPQFMPSSWNRYAIDYDGDGKVDLFTSPADAIGSVANYFKSFGWQNGLPTHYPVSFDTARLDKETLLLPDILPTFNPERFAALGAQVQADAAAPPKGPLALIELQNGSDEPSYVAGTENFYVITRYNWSSYYAMAVIHLGREIAKAMR